MRPQQLLLKLLVLASLLGLGACAYSTTPGLPPEIKTIAVPVFKNKTYYQRIEAQLTAAVIKNINQTPRLQVASQKADAELTGEIYDIKNIVTEYDANDQPLQARVVISVRYSLYDKQKSEFIYYNINLNNAQSSVLEGMTTIGRRETLEEARNSAVEELARHLVRRLTTGW